jgi:zinc protease
MMPVSHTVRVAAFASATALMLLAGPAMARVFDPVSFTLANGLQVVVVVNRRAPVVTHMIWYKVGAADEPAGKSGIAHLLEHLMFKGTVAHPAGEFSKIVARAMAGARTPSPATTIPAISRPWRPTGWP